MQVKIKKCHTNAVIPKYQTDDAAAMDLHSVEDVFVPLGAIKLIDTGIAMAIPKGFEGQIRPRSGLATKGITIINSPGTIDSDFRNSIKVIIWNVAFGKDQNYDDAYALHGWSIKARDRIAQILIAPTIKAELIEVEELDETARGEGGFGSTGI